jgi:pilus assembly protein TadC
MKCDLILGSASVLGGAWWLKIDQTFISLLFHLFMVIVGTALIVSALATSRKTAERRP